MVAANNKINHTHRGTCFVFTGKQFSLMSNVRLSTTSNILFRSNIWITRKTSYMKKLFNVRKLFQRECLFNINYICQRLYNCSLFQIVSVCNNSYVYSKNGYVLDYFYTNTYFNDICEYTYRIYRCWHLISWISFPSMISFLLQDLCWARNRLYTICTVCSFSFGHIKLDITKKENNNI